MHLILFQTKISFKIYPENIVVVQYNILKIFTMHFSKINQTYYTILL